MFVTIGKDLSSLLILILTACALAHPMCPVHEVVVKGQMDHPPNHPKVKVQLVYAKQMLGESADITPETDKFTVPVDFLTQSRGPVLNGSFEKCGRKPIAVIVTLLDGKTDHEYDRLSFDVAKDFKKVEPSTYMKSDVLLKGPQ